MEILSILELFMNMMKQKKADAAMGTANLMDAASRIGGTDAIAKAAEQYPSWATGFKQNTGIGSTPVMKEAAGAGEQMGFAASAPLQPVMTQQLPNAFQRMVGIGPKDVPLTKPNWPEYRPTPEVAMGQERLKEQTAAARANIFANFVRPPKEAGGTPISLQPEEIESIYTGKMPEGVVSASSLTMEKAHESQKAFVRQALGKVNYTIDALDPYVKQLGVDTGQFKVENGKYMLSKAENKIIAPHVVSYNKGQEQVTEIIRKPGQEATPEIAKAPRQLPPQRAPLDEKDAVTSAFRIEDDARANANTIMQAQGRGHLVIGPGGVAIFQLQNPEKDTAYYQEVITDEYNKLAKHYSKSYGLNIAEKPGKGTPHPDDVKPLIKESKKATITYKDDTGTYEVPPKEVAAFKKVHPKATRTD